MADYKGAPLASRPATLDSAEYYHLTPEQRRAEDERLALRARLKRQYQLQLNDPNRRAPFEDPALTRWTYARTLNVYPNFRPTPKTSFLGFVWGVGPLFVIYYVLKYDRERKEKLIQEGKYERPFSLSY
ncbi:NADH dehydrogenase [ubiquinone] 1 beta subcomplex subunit 4 [Microcaecilia unicolor]|uniref:NADH dehydrogenase [ubiquinone] 1 beta subcomplex subunit 4 n=1 Tax=Microcaecilia unicolor TaxID=1415580 RepID=A0A6P7XWP7_9AMPH|nr:NADH dehydrogenase [ubiquinone] 1 beta subcomplex subunit 4 [Microcaecilia unicolor]